jgi:hypothetical protein
VQKSRDGVAVRLANGATGNIATYRLPEDVAVGDAVEVVIAALEVDDGDLILEFVRREEEPSAATNDRTPAGTAT